MDRVNSLPSNITQPMISAMSYVEQYRDWVGWITNRTVYINSDFWDVNGLLVNFFYNCEVIMYRHDKTPFWREQTYFFVLRTFRQRQLNIHLFWFSTKYLDRPGPACFSSVVSLSEPLRPGLIIGLSGRSKGVSTTTAACSGLSVCSQNPL